ncbi:Uncharacterised protein [Mycobacteroides abscessus]|nr:Uncharacterised protein [Mycobacteroides abscessus]
MRSPSESRMPPNPYASADQVPPADATCTPSDALACRFARSTKIDDTKYSSASSWYPTSAATMDCTTPESVESPVVNGS